MTELKSISKNLDIHVRSDREWEQVVFAEVLVPDVANVYGDYWSATAIRHAAYAFMMQGFGIDVEHDNIDITGGKAVVVESFIARANDPDGFIEGAWVVGMKITDATLWADILSGEINGYSYEALVSFFTAVLTVLDDGIRQGVTEPDTTDGHVHNFVVMVDVDNRPIEGGTSFDHGHSHVITRHSITEADSGHKHRYNLVQGKDGK